MLVYFFILLFLFCFGVNPGWLSSSRATPQAVRIRAGGPALLHTLGLPHLGAFSQPPGTTQALLLSCSFSQSIKFQMILIPKDLAVLPATQEERVGKGSVSQLGYWGPTGWGRPLLHVYVLSRITSDQLHGGSFQCSAQTNLSESTGHCIRNLGCMELQAPGTGTIAHRKGRLPCM